jgi:hypothetical protein
MSITPAPPVWDKDAEQRDGCLLQQPGALATALTCKCLISAAKGQLAPAKSRSYTTTAHHRWPAKRGYNIPISRRHISSNRGHYIPHKTPEQSTTAALGLFQMHVPESQQARRAFPRPHKTWSSLEPGLGHDDRGGYIHSHVAHGHDHVLDRHRRGETRVRKDDPQPLHDTQGITKLTSRPQISPRSQPHQTATDKRTIRKRSSLFFSCYNHREEAIRGSTHRGGGSIAPVVIPIGLAPRGREDPSHLPDSRPTPQANHSSLHQRAGTIIKAVDA